MALRPQSMREWAVIIIGSMLVVGVIVWLYLVDPWMIKLEKNNDSIKKYKETLTDAREKLNKRVVLENEFNVLSKQYSNHLQNISNVRMPDNLKDNSHWLNCRIPCTSTCIITARIPITTILITGGKVLNNSTIARKYNNNG